MRVPVIAANWKMNKSASEAGAFVRAFKPLVADVSGAEIVICPPFTDVTAVLEGVRGTKIEVGGQNSHTEISGAYTGEVGAPMLKADGCAWVIAGHSERRRYFGESDALINMKVKAGLAAGLKVIFCIGETLEERENVKMDEVLRRQVSDGLSGVSQTDLARIVVAYEPVWAIGTGVTATPDQADEAHGFVRALIAKQYNETAAESLRIQYGGSVKPDNAADLLSQPNVDGALVGGASLDPAGFAAIVKAGAATAARAS